MASARNASGLTDRQERFAQYVAGGASQAEAYRRAYPTSLKWPDSAVWSKASQLANNAFVMARVEDIKSPAVERVRAEIVYTAKEAMAEALRALELAETIRQPGAMVAAIQLRAKLQGLITDKKEIAVTQMGDMTPGEKGYLLEQAKAMLEERKELLERERANVTDVIPK